ncbi:WSC-domain-containing protein, partial [Punctularia strigosozonata HHB-11173 SS5]|uniref:WSC-domain-containing protein n=1 Tax=Punctularia strigosozonata (strain HHB-11173) TaxID=741275 RepID=UPI0004416790
ECYCGTGYSVDPSTIDNAPASECSMACAGDDTLTCGGSWRMQIYSTGLSPAAGEAPSGWSSYGCVRDTSDRVLASPKYAGADLSDTNSPAACTSYCADLNYTMAGVEYGSECYCSSSWASDTAPSLIDSSECDYACSGAPALTCGGSWALQVYSAS